MTRSSFESPLMPREIADAPDIENIPVANWMHTLSQTVMDMHQMLREIRDGLATQPDPDGGVEMTTAEWEGFTGSGAQNAPQGSVSPLPGIPGGPEGATGAPGGAGEVGLGDAIRTLMTTQHEPTRLSVALPVGDLRALAERADALERDLARVNQIDAEGHDLLTLASENLTLAAQVEQWQDSAKYAVRQVERVRALADGAGSGFPYVQVADLRAIVGGTQ